VCNPNVVISAKYGGCGGFDKEVDFLLDIINNMIRIYSYNE